MIRAGAGLSQNAASERAADSSPLDLEVSVVIPCLNEADTLASCIGKAAAALAEQGIRGEIIVADNGSTDESRAIAARAGARVVEIAAKGYGNALMAGIAAARGRFVVMGDADDSYDFREIPSFVARLRQGADLVQGCRLPAGGGSVAAGAMPFLHRWWGNPMFSAMARRMFHVPVHDVNCGMRAFSKELYERLEQQCTGMEFACEMLVRASFHGAEIVEVPIAYHRSGRRSHAPHLRTFRDGWRTLRFFLLYSPRWLFLAPGVALIVLGLIGYALAMPGTTIRGVTFDVHTLLFASLAILCGYQAILFSLFSQTYGMLEGLLPENKTLRRLFDVVDLEKGLLLASAALIAGLALLGIAFNEWRAVRFGNLNYLHTMRLVAPGMTLATLGFQTILSSFFMSIMGMRRKSR
jgi:glycosyltransferase involved in cell wall biosynthesis